MSQFGSLPTSVTGTMMHIFIDSWSTTWEPPPSQCFTFSNFSLLLGTIKMAQLIPPCSRQSRKTRWLQSFHPSLRFLAILSIAITPHWVSSLNTLTTRDSSKRRMSIRIYRILFYPVSNGLRNPSGPWPSLLLATYSFHYHIAGQMNLQSTPSLTKSSTITWLSRLSVVSTTHHFRQRQELLLQVD